MGRRSLRLTSIQKFGKKGKAPDLESFKTSLKQEAQGRAELFKDYNIPGVGKYRNFIAFCQYGEEPKIITEDQLKAIRPVKPVLSMIDSKTGERIGDFTINDEIPRAGARARFEDAHRKDHHLTKKDGYCRYCSCLIHPPEGIKLHLQSEEHKKNKKLVEAKHRQFSNDMKWICPKYSVEKQRVEFELINPKTGEKIADLTTEDLIKYQEGYRKCQNCGSWFQGRIDAKFCSDKCRVANHEKQSRTSTVKN